MTLLQGTVQPGLLTLLSSTSKPAISPLFTFRTDPDHQKDSNVQVLEDITLLAPTVDSNERGSLVHPVLHLQGPDISRTYIQAGSSKTQCISDKARGKQAAQEPLGVELPWLGLHFRLLGHRPFALEVGVVDAKGREGAIRISSFAKEPSIHLNRPIPLLHLPLGVPTTTETTLTPWLHLSVNLAELIQLFEKLPRTNTKKGDDSDYPRKRQKTSREMPNGQFKSVNYIKVYANCRIRRIWFAEDGERTLDQLDRTSREEWALYAAEQPVM